MADQKLTQLSAATLPLQNSDLFYIVQNLSSATATSNKINFLNLSTSIISGGGGVSNTIHVLTTQAEASLLNSFNLGGLTSGIIKQTVSVGVSTPAIATAGTDYSTPSSTDTLTNKTLNAEATGNVITIPFKLWLPFAGTNGASASTIWDLPASSAPTAVAFNGSNIFKGALAFADGQSAQMTWILPSDWTGAIDAKILFYSPDTSGTVIFNIATAFTIAGGSATDDPAFNAADAFNTITLASPANALWNATKTGITITNSAAGKLVHIKISRATDTATSAVNAVGLELTYRRAMV